MHGLPREGSGPGFGDRLQRGRVVAALLATWIWLYVRPSDLVLGGWIATVLAALYLAGRIVREIAYGVIRARSRG